MKIAVACANGKAGRLIVKEAVERGADVTAFVRGENKTVAEKSVIKDIFDIKADDLKGYATHSVHGQKIFSHSTVHL